MDRLTDLEARARAGARPPRVLSRVPRPAHGRLIPAWLRWSPWPRTSRRAGRGRTPRAGAGGPGTEPGPERAPVLLGGEVPDPDDHRRRHPRDPRRRHRGRGVLRAVQQERGTAGQPAGEPGQRHLSDARRRHRRRRGQRPDHPRRLRGRASARPASSSSPSTGRRSPTRSTPARSPSATTWSTCSTRARTRRATRPSAATRSCARRRTGPSRRCTRRSTTASPRRAAPASPSTTS